MKSAFNPSLTVRERHRVSDAIYRMKKEGFIIPEELLTTIKGTITQVDTYETIRRQVTETEGVTFQAIRQTVKGKVYRAEGVVSGKVAEDFLRESRKWNAERTKIPKRGEGNIIEAAPKYSVTGVGPHYTETKGKEQEEINEMYRKAFERQTQTMRKYTPRTRVEQQDRQARLNVESSLNQQVQNSPQIKQMVLDGIAKMGRSELREFLERLGPAMTGALYASDQSADALLLGMGDPLTGGAVQQPILSIINRLGYDINQPALDGLKDSTGEPIETIAEYIMRIDLTGGRL